MKPNYFAVVYATGSKQLRRIILPDDDPSLANGNFPLAPGESMLVISDDGDHSLEACRAHIKRHTGVDSPELRCALVSRTNVVTDILMADPDIDTHPDGMLIHAYAEEVRHECTYDPETKLFYTPDRVVINRR